MRDFDGETVRSVTESTSIGGIAGDPIVSGGTEGPPYESLEFYDLPAVEKPGGHTAFYYSLLCFIPGPDSLSSGGKRFSSIIAYRVIEASDENPGGPQ
jgi:hypothetical protein